MKIILSLLSVTFLWTISYSQTKGSKTWLQQKFELADSVSITSHEPTSGIVLVDSNGNEIPLPRLLKNNKPNDEIIKEHKELVKTSIDSLIQILARPFKDSVSSVGGCYIPRQTIFLFKGKQVSYIDICFQCRNYETSKDFSGLSAFDDRKWNALEDFFIRQGLSYELNKE